MNKHLFASYPNAFVLFCLFLIFCVNCLHEVIDNKQNRTIDEFLKGIVYSIIL